MLDTREYLGFIEPVWHLEVARDSEAAVGSLRQLKQAAAMNARATAVLFPWLVAAAKSWRQGSAQHQTKLQEPVK